ncbi:hypothetical protein [Longimicrobium sp.]
MTDGTNTSGMDPRDNEVRRPFVPPAVENLGSLETTTLLTPP